MTSSGTTDPAAGGSVISLPSGGGAISGLGEKFTPDLFTGTGNFSVPIAVPAGRRGVQPQLSLGYSSGSGNGPFGLGWQLGLPGVTRKTSRGVPRYHDVAGPDVFLLSGAEDLVPVAVPGAAAGRVRYRPRTEGLFARIEHVTDATGDFWEVRGRDGMLTRYGTPRPAGAGADWRDPAVLADPGDPGRVFGWRVTEARDPLGNLMRYEYVRDHGDRNGHRWDLPLLSRISYGDYGDPAAPSFLLAVEFDYEDRPDPFSDYRAGFEIRTTRRCRTIRVVTRTAEGVARVSREHRLSYTQSAFNGVSLLARVDVVGVDGSTEEPLPPLAFGYSSFDPAGRRFQPVTGRGLPASSLSDPTLAMVDLRGVGLPDIVELGATKRFWRNAGGGRFELPRSMAQAPSFSLGEPGVRFMDADGDGRADLVVSGVTSAGAAAGYFPMTFAGGWSQRSFQPYRQVPSVSLADPSVRLIDLDGDGLTDVLRSGARLEGWFNDPDPRRAWQRTVLSNGSSPGVDFADPRIRLADMTGDGLTDIVLVRSGNVGYWPNLGHGRFGALITMRHSPRLPDRYDPRRVLLGDVDGDGVADLLYVDNGRVLLWGNQGGEAFTEQPVKVTGTPTIVDTEAIELSDLTGSGLAGLVFSRAADGSGRPHLRFLDFTGGVKPHLLQSVDNHLGALIRVSYGPSTAEYLRDQVDPATRWRTTLPFPTQVVTGVEVLDAISGGRLTTEYRYHHGYWDGVEREFRGFAMVEQLDTETIDLSGAPEHFSPPTLTKNWFHPGPVAALEAGDWTELDLRHEYWQGDQPVLSRPRELTAFLAGLSRTARRSALRALRGQALRTELFALDGTDRADRPYTVTESLGGVRAESAPADQIYFPFPLGQRTTQWERGDEPLTQYAFTGGYDAYGMATQQLAIATPRRAGEPALATYVTTEYARRDDAGHYLIDRVAQQSTFEVVNDGSQSAVVLRDTVLSGAASVTLRILAHSRTYYDGDAFAGLPLGVLGEHGLAMRAESLALTDEFLDGVFTVRPVYLSPDGSPAWPAEYPPEFRALTPALAGYAHDQSGFYITSARHRYDVGQPGRVPRGLLLESLDPLGAPSGIEYDEHDLLPVRTTDAAGLVTEAVHDYRLLRPSDVTDANGTTKSVTFSPAGLVTAQYQRGRAGEGDQDLPGTLMEYDLLAFARRGEPASVRSTRRVVHDATKNVPPVDVDQVLVSVEFSDGFGRTVQTRVQAEDSLFGDVAFGGGVLPADQSAKLTDTVGRTRDPAAPDNVIVSGWQVFDNKGRVVEKFEPFYATGYAYSQPGDALLGQRTVLRYDPRGQVIRTVNPDGSEQRVIFGIPADLTDPDTFAPTAWESYTYDANDNAGRTHGPAADGFAGHWNTPSSVEFDALGRVARAVARNGVGAPSWLTTTSQYDIRGNVVSIVDPLGRQAFRYQFDLAKRRWVVDGNDAGRRLSVLDAAGNLVESRDSKGALALGAFDVLHRASRVWARDGLGGPVTLRRSFEYGDAGTPDQPPAQRAAARAANLLGRLTRHHDEAGLVTVDAVDFKGNVTESTRRVIADTPILQSYKNAAANGWQVTPFQVDWTPTAGQTQQAHDDGLLEPAGYVTSTSYDALNRVTRHTFPTDVEGNRRELRPTYNRAGALDQVRLDDTLYVQRIAYDAKGQRALIALGDGVMTRYAYDPHTFRLVRLRSERYTLSGAATYQSAGPALQDYGYDYDLVGNVRTIRDRVAGSGIVNNPDALSTTDPVLRKLLGAGDALDRRFGYDPIYRLLTATGREQAAPPVGDPWRDGPRGTDVTKAQPYTETYQYDALGNLLALNHAGVGGFTRTFTVAGDSSRLHRLTVGNTSYDYTFDANGNVLDETTSRHYAWNHADQLKVFATQVAGAEPSVHAQYLYDSAGQRVKKLVRRQGGAIEVTHYIGEAFEHHRWVDSTAGTTPIGTNNHLHVLDDRQRVALVRVGPARQGDGGPAIAYQLGDQLGSANAVLDDTGALTNREEFTPYGETSFGGYARKRYRFTGRERDEESSLVYLSARFYAPWTGRWTCCEPAGGLSYPTGALAPEVMNSYWYAAGNPLRYVDPSGRAPDDPGVDLSQKVSPVDGTIAHFDILPELAERLTAAGYPAAVDTGGTHEDLSAAGVLTLPGGSLSGKSRGEMDLLMPRLEHDLIVGHVYELKPGRSVGLSRTERQVLKQSSFGAKLLAPGRPLAYKPGTILDELNDLVLAVVFRPIVKDKGTFIRTYSISPLSDGVGGFVPGRIVYSFVDRKKTDDEKSDPLAKQPPLIIEKPNFRIGDGRSQGGEIDQGDGDAPADDVGDVGERRAARIRTSAQVTGVAAIGLIIWHYWPVLILAL